MSKKMYESLCLGDSEHRMNICVSMSKNVSIGMSKCKWESKWAECYYE